jgi:hypothetical protein
VRLYRRDVLGSADRSEGQSEDLPPRHARLLVAAVLVMVAASALFSLNLWPFSSWNLFSGIRTDGQTSWEAVAVDASGVDHDYAIGALGHGARTIGPVLAAFERSSATDRAAICDGWLRGTETSLGARARAVRIYRVRWRLSDRRAGTGIRPERTALWTCTAEGARAPR